MKYKFKKILNEIASIYDVDQWDNAISPGMQQNIASSIGTLTEDWKKIFRKWWFPDTSKNLIKTLENDNLMCKYFCKIFISPEEFDRWANTLNEQFKEQINKGWNEKLFQNPEDVLDLKWNITLSWANGGVSNRWLSIRKYKHADIENNLSPTDKGCGIGTGILGMTWMEEVFENQYNKKEWGIDKKTWNRLLEFYTDLTNYIWLGEVFTLMYDAHETLEIEI